MFSSCSLGFPPHCCHQAIKTIFAILGLIMSILGAIVRLDGHANTEGVPSSPFIKMSASVARVLCPECYSANDESFRFCRRCGKSVSHDQARAHTSLQVDEEVISRRYVRFTTACAGRASAKSRSATWALFSRFLASRANGAIFIESTQPKDVVEFLCWLDSCGKRRRTVVHARHCAAVGTKDLTTCSTSEGECDLRFTSKETCFEVVDGV